MPMLGELPSGDEIRNFSSDTASFLKPNAIRYACEVLSNSNSLREEIKNDIEAEKSEGKGLSETAFLIDGAAPLNSLTSKLISELDVTNDAIKNIGKSITMPSGNLHRQGEAKEYFDNVRERYHEKFRKDVNDAIDAFNNYEYSYIETYYENGSSKSQPKTGSYSEISKIDQNGDDKVQTITVPPKNVHDSGDTYNQLKDAIDNAVIDAQEFYDDPFIPAQELNNKCQGLKTDVSDVSNSTNGESERTLDSSVPTSIGVDDIFQSYDTAAKAYPDGLLSVNDNINIVSVSDGNGGMLSYQYDKDGNLVFLRDYKDGEYDNYYTADGEAGTFVSTNKNTTTEGYVVPTENKDNIIMLGAGASKVAEGDTYYYYSSTGRQSAYDDGSKKYIIGLDGRNPIEVSSTDSQGAWIAEKDGDTYRYQPTGFGNGPVLLIVKHADGTIDHYDHNGNIYQRFDSNGKLISL